MHSKTLVGIIFSIAIFSFGCSDTILTRPADRVLAAAATGQYCTLNLTTTPGIKFYFAIDVTGSNIDGDTTDDGVPVPPTDPGKTIRFGAIQGLSQKYPEARFALRTFAGDSVNDAFRSSYFSFTNQLGFLNTTLPAFQNIPDGGGTNYGVILQQIQTDIQQYLQAQINLPPSEQDTPGPIVILFGSDGIPHEGCKDQGCMQTLVNQIVAMPLAMNATHIIPYITGGAFGWGGIFGAAGQATNAQRFLQWIADAFSGGLLIAQPGQPLDLTKLPLPAAQTPQGVNFDLYATNLNGVWDKTSTGTAKFNLDSDGDGISDQQEIVLGSNPNLADSDGNGLGDGLESFIWGTPCQLGGCAKPNPDTRAPINTCKNIPAADGGSSGFYTNDILNNCEKIAAGVDYHFFSYLRDNVADGVKVRNFLSPTNTTLGQPNPDNGNLSFIQEIKMNLPTFIPNPLNAGYVPTKYNVTFMGTQGTKNCYNFNIQGLPVVGNNPNRVRLWLTQTQSNLPDILRTADVMAVPGQPISVSDDDFRPNQHDIQNAQ